VSEKSLDHRRLRLNEGQHLSVMLGIYATKYEKRERFTSAGFLFKKMALIFAKCEAMTI
jgi:hypothetical protein